MINEVLRKENVLEFFKDMVDGTIYKNKNIPNSISDEKIDTNYYAILMGLDAIIKYVLIVDDDSNFNDYLEQVKFLLRKVDNHNEIKIGISKLIINYCQKKLLVPNISTLENKIIIFKYIYNKYVVDGYFFHAFPSKFVNYVNQNGLLVSNYNYELNSIKEVEEIFKKYNLENVFSRELNSLKPHIVVTDSPFMGCYYAYHSPFFLYDLSFDKDKMDSFFIKDYKTVKKSLNSFLRKDMFNADMLKIIDFFDKEWDLFNINDSVPVMCFIKRSSLGNNSLKDIDTIFQTLENEDLITSVTKVLDTRFNQEKIENDISRLSFEICYLPTLEELGFTIDELNKKGENVGLDKKYEIINEYGTTTIIALLGVLLISIGILLMLFMMG